jgi:phytoene dehydrogenase-like protein
LDYALSVPVPWTAEEAREAAVVHVGGELQELTAAAQAGARGEVPARPALVVGQQSLYDNTRAPAGQHTLYVYAHVPATYPESDEHVAELIERQLERFAPGFASAVRSRTMRPPAQIERENPSLVGGDLGGGSYDLDQQLIFRPTPQLPDPDWGPVRRRRLDASRWRGAWDQWSRSSARAAPGKSLATVAQTALTTRRR